MLSFVFVDGCLFCSLHWWSEGVFHHHPGYPLLFLRQSSVGFVQSQSVLLSDLGSGCRCRWSCDKNGNWIIPHLRIGSAAAQKERGAGIKKVHQVKIASRRGMGSISGRRVSFFPLALSVRWALVLGPDGLGWLGRVCTLVRWGWVVKCCVIRGSVTIRW